MTDDQEFPVLDEGLLQVLKEEAGPDVAQAFMEEYLLMLPVRAAKILKGLALRDVEASAEACISLRASSALAGARRLEQYCRNLESTLKRGHLPDAAAVRTVLFANIRHVIREASRQGHLPTNSPGPADS